MGGQLADDRQQLAGMERGKPCLVRRGTGAIVERREGGERVFVHPKLPRTMPVRVPRIFFVLEAWHGTAPVVGERGVHRGRSVEVGDVVERRRGGRSPVDVDAESRAGVNFREQLQLVRELKVGAQARVHLAAEPYVLGVVVDALRMEEARDPGGAADHPRLGQEALV